MSALLGRMPSAVGYQPTLQTCTLANACKYGISAVLRGNISDKLLNQYGLTNTGAAEQADLTALLVRT